MKKGQKLSKGGYQLIGFPMETMNITQGNNVGTHLGTNALDNAGKDTGIEETIVPFDMVYKAHDTAANGNAIWFQSKNKVRFRDGDIDYATIMCLHDNYIGDILALANKGYVFKQGETFGDEGTAGKAYGNHLHFEIAKGKFTHCYDQNPQGVWHLPNNISADLACVTDGTIIKNKGSFKNWADSSVLDGKTETDTKLNSIPSDFVYEKATFYPNTTIKIRKAPSLKGEDTGVRYKKGQSVVYDGYVRREGYVWISWIGASSGERRWMAAGELNSNRINTRPYGTFK